MKFSTPIIKGRILKRYKRFLADIEFLEDHNEHKKGDIVTVHTANTGSMKTCWEAGWPALISFHDIPTRKLKYSLEMTHNGETWIGVNTSLPNKLAVEAIKSGQIPELSGYEHIRPEQKIGKSRIDIYLYNGDKKNPKDECYVEIKNVTLLGENNKALFPDSVSTRGQKHLNELTQLKRNGIRSVMLYIIQREDIESFSPAKLIDSDYANLLKNAHEEGVEILPYQCSLNEEEVVIKCKVPYCL